MEVKWIKIATDMFNNRKIKQIRKMPDGDALIVVWMQLLCLAGTVNNCGLVYFAKDIPFTDEMLAVEFDRPISTIRLALATFEKFGMIEVVNDVLLVSNWEKHQSAEKLEKIRENSRIRQQRYRENQKLLAENNVSVTLPVTLGNAIDKDKDKDIPPISPKVEIPPILEKWLKYKKERKDKPYKETGLNTLIAKTNRMITEYGEQNVSEVIDDSIASNYQGIVWDWLKNKKLAKGEKITFLRPDGTRGEKIL